MNYLDECPSGLTPWQHYLCSFKQGDHNYYAYMTLTIVLIALSALALIILAIYLLRRFTNWVWNLYPVRRYMLKKQVNYSLAELEAVAKDTAQQMWDLLKENGGHAKR